MALISFSKDKHISGTSSQEVVFDAHACTKVEDANTRNGLASLLAQMDGVQCRHFVTDGSWSLFDFLLKLAETKPIEELYITTYSMTEMSARVIGQLVVDKKILKVFFLMDYKSEMRYPNVHQILRNIGTLEVTKLHAKVMIVKFSDEQYYTLIGSANWTQNPRVEAGVLDNNPTTAKQHIQWINKKITDAANSR